MLVSSWIYVLQLPLRQRLAMVSSRLLHTQPVTACAVGLLGTSSNLTMYNLLPFTLQLQKRRLMSESDDKKTDRDKLFAEQRAIKDTIRGPSNLQVRGAVPGVALYLLPTAVTILVTYCCSVLTSWRCLAGSSGIQQLWADACSLG